MKDCFLKANSIVTTQLQPKMKLAWKGNFKDVVQEIFEATKTQELLVENLPSVPEDENVFDGQSTVDEEIEARLIQFKFFRKTWCSRPSGETEVQEQIPLMVDRASEPKRNDATGTDFPIYSIVLRKILTSLMTDTLKRLASFPLLPQKIKINSRPWIGPIGAGRPQHQKNLSPMKSVMQLSTVPWFRYMEVICRWAVYSHRLSF